MVGMKQLCDLITFPNSFKNKIGLLYIHSVHALIQVHFQINGMYYFEEYSESFSICVLVLGKIRVNHQFTHENSFHCWKEPLTLFCYFEIN
jgi:hypothetical protein